MVDGGDLSWGGEPTIRRTDAVLRNCAPGTCITLCTSEKMRDVLNKKVAFREVKGYRCVCRHTESYILILKNRTLVKNGERICRSD